MTKDAHALDEIVVLVSCSCGAAFAGAGEGEAYDHWATHAAAADAEQANAQLDWSKSWQS